MSHFFYNNHSKILSIKTERASTAVKMTYMYSVLTQVTILSILILCV